MRTAYETLQAARALNIDITANGEKLHIEAPTGVLTLELQRELKAHKSEILYILPEPARPGAEVEELRKNVGEMVRAEEDQWILSDELDPAWPPSSGVRKRLRRKEMQVAL